MKAIALLTGMLLALSACRTAPEAVPTAFYRFAGMPAALEGKAAVGAEYHVDLEENGTTGYLWHIAECAPGCQATLEHLPGKSDLCGAPGSVRVHVTPNAPGKHIVRLEYKRHWEKVPPIHSITLTVTGQN